MNHAYAKVAVIFDIQLPIISKIARVASFTCINAVRVFLDELEEIYHRREKLGAEKEQV